MPDTIVTSKKKDWSLKRRSLSERVICLTVGRQGYLDTSKKQTGCMADFVSMWVRNYVGWTLHPSTSHVLWETSTMPSSLCASHRIAGRMPRWLNVGRTGHPSTSHVLLTTLTMPSSLCASHRIAGRMPGWLNVGWTLHPSTSHVLWETSNHAF